LHQSVDGEAHSVTRQDISSELLLQLVRDVLYTLQLVTFRSVGGPGAVAGMTYDLELLVLLTARAAAE
jgi:hypothetical protein